MKIKLTESKEYDVHYLRAQCGVRYWEDSEVDGVEDTEGQLIPCRVDDYWMPLIDLERGVIINWEIGKTAKVHYKVCDDGVYRLLDKDKNIVKEIDGYVPDLMCPEGDGFGDYVIMNIDANGKIDKWRVSSREFQQED
jgi:hypothetical protein